MAAPLSQYLGQQVVVENRSGASGTIGADAVAKSAPEGYNPQLSSGSAMSIMPHLRRLPCELKDLIPVAPVARLGAFLVTRGDFPANNAQEFLRCLRANPGKLSFASHVRNGRLKLLAVGAAKRSALFPDVPTLAESGLPGFDAGTTHGFWYPARTSTPIVERMNREINRAMGEKAVSDAIRSLGAEPRPMSPEQFGQVIEADSRRYVSIIRERRITAE